MGGDRHHHNHRTRPESSTSSSESPEARGLAQSPILLLVCFHKAMRAELADLRHVTTAGLDGGFRGRGFVLEVLRRFEFLKLAYKYHCSAEDEIVFLALDGRTKNIACTYSLEHRSIDGLFDSIFSRLDVLLEESEDFSKEFQELVFCIGTLQAFICQHMVKEEEQVFPLLLQQFSPKEQAALVWQFMCSMPLVLLEDLLPWMISSLQIDEKEEVIHCIIEIVPDEKHLREVVSSWLAIKGQARHTSDDESADMKKLLKSHSPKRFFEENWSCMKEDRIQTDTGYSPVDGLHLWHGAIRKNLEKMMGELYQLRNSVNFLNIDSIVVQLKFLADVLTFYRNALEKLFHPVLKELVNGSLYPSIENFPDESFLESLQNLLYHSLENGTPLGKYVEKLCQEFECLVVGVGKHFDFYETEVFPIMRKNCSHEMQQQLVYVSLHIMPLGLLKCVTTWFSACLSEDESRSILSSMKQRDFIVNESFVSLVHEWFQIGHSGKTSIENFQKDLQQIFKSRCTFLCNQLHASSSVSSNTQHRGKSSNEVFELNSSNKAKKSMPHSSSFASDSSTYSETSNSRGINLQVYFSGLNTAYHIRENLSGETLSGYGIHEPKPIDLIFFFHKALKKDLEYLVLGSAELAENAAFLTDFCLRFSLIQFLHQIHSEAEDEVAFPALEAKGKCQNISQSYTMDHKLEVELFQKISLILDEMCKLHFSVSMVDSNTMDQMSPKHYQLSMRLHGLCKSMCKLLTDHIRREEVELWPLFRECFSIEEQERIVGCILGRTGAKVLQDMIPWLMDSLTPEEQHAMISIWRQVTRNTMFDEWLKEWWEGYDSDKVVEESSLPPSKTVNPLEVSTYISKLDEQERSVCKRSINFPENDFPDTNTKPLRISEANHKLRDADSHQCNYNPTESGSLSEGKKMKCGDNEDAINQINDPVQLPQASGITDCHKCLMTLSQEDLLTAISKISHDSSLDPQKKPYMMQNLLSSHWRVRQHSQLIASDGQKIPGQHPSYQDFFGLTFGCKHYRRNCKVVAPCCNQLYTCIRCHDEMADHTIDRRSVTEMMCMKCLKIQPIGHTCSTASCSDLSMARYFCKIFDDERIIYHCPYCNLCRVGKGLGIDYFHCMTCNACMSCSLFKHICREKSFMDNCPICHEDIFTSNSPVKALPCGHSMHSTCFQAYTYTNYTCPICGKSLGDMQMLFRMFDAYMAGEKLPDEYSGRTQAILCNDCEKKGKSPFHWLYHKCSSCGSYNTSLL
ncbi:zinc finger protein BRUTUS-like At1g74770 [Argentina anserina]|uniref:zinc finger protein BRUTUS-like At1g74770 n=1 Tax=Argentina anserina TaxID=57926 RepID=UPI0021768426|nr:zinc finger protein BRUTUS-like At1g74770 [Potentilla anserina]